MSQLKALGGLKLEDSAFTRPLPLVLLSYLSLEGRQQRKHVAELFWQDGNLMKSLSMTLTRLRQGAGEVIAGDQQKIWASISSDVKALLESLDKSQWQRASELYTGAFLEGIVLKDWGSELEEWVYTTREYLAERVQYALLNLAEEAAKAQDFDKAGELAERAYTLPGLASNEPTTLKRLYTLLCAGANLRAPEVRKEAEDYGLKLELTKQAAREMFKPSSKTTSLPLRGTSFVGRDEELTELATLLNKPNVSLLTLLGPAGVGKTRLALQLAHEQQKLGAFKDGVHFIPLDALNDSGLLPSSLLGHLGLTQPGKTELLTQVIDFIADKTLLLVLDNFEHLIEGSSLLSTLTSKCPNLKLFVTSRERLNVEEEFIYALEGLPYSKELSDDATLSDAVQLFNERARQVQSRFRVDEHLTDVIRICELVEGLPLGLELAASWVRLMSCKDIGDEIERGLELLVSASKNVPERHRSLKAAFEQSWKLLTPKEQEVLRKLSVFVGGFRREAASEVAGATIPVLASLVDKSLLKVLPNGRYDRHPLLYQFTKEKLSEQVDEQLETQAKHAHFQLALAEQAQPHLQGKEQHFWFQRLSEEHGNVRVVFAWLDALEDTTTALKLATLLSSFWFLRGNFHEGRTCLTALLTKTNDVSNTRAEALLHAGRFNFMQGDYPPARAYYEESLDIAKGLQALSIWARALLGLGQVSYHQGDTKGSRPLYESGLELARRSGDKTTLASALFRLGAFEQEQARNDQARAYLGEAERLFAELGNDVSRARTLNSLANVWADLGEADKALHLYEESLELLRALGDEHGAGITLINLGNNVERQGDEAKAITYYQEALTLFRDFGDKRMVSFVLVNLGTTFHHQGNLSKARALLEESLALQRSIGDMQRLADVLRSLGNVSRERGDQEEAYRYYHESLHICREQGDMWAVIRGLDELANWYVKKVDYIEASRALNEALGLASKTNDKLALISLLETRATLETLSGEAVVAAQLLAHVKVMRQHSKLARKANQHSEVQEQLVNLRERLGQKIFAEAWVRGKRLEPGQILELALKGSDSSPRQPSETVTTTSL